MFKKLDNKLVYTFDAEKLWIEPWGNNSLRVRSTKEGTMPINDWALIPASSNSGVISINESCATISNGNITASITGGGLLKIFNKEGKVLLCEYSRNRRDLLAEKCSAIEVEAREFKPILNGDYQLTMRFESLDPDERIYGMGQYQQPYLNLKGLDLELAHRNSQSTVPFAVSSMGYGILWNNPAVGRVVFGKNIMSYEAKSTKVLDYWVTAGETPSEILEAYAAVTGTVPEMPEFAMGFWQSKLRYQTQDELLHIAREYKKRNLPISVIVIDFFHWVKQGDWKLDPTYWQNPEAMVSELKNMGIELMVSVWPTVDKESENYKEMLERGLLIRTERGVRVGLDFQGQTIHFDATNPDARKYVWEKCRTNYFDKGIRVFWLDEAEPEYTIYDFDNYRYWLGPNTQIGNIYPYEYARTFFEGQTEEGQKQVINLIRSAWAGSQKFGALVWSGDIASSFDSLRNQFAAGLNMGMAGIPWWTTDIGGFHGGNPDAESFREILIRWFQYGTFCPVMRIHGDREPQQAQQGTTGGAACCSGADNEVWSFGEQAYDICKKYLEIREKLKPYISKLMKEAHEKGSPVMRPLFYEFPKDKIAWEIENAYLFGSHLLVAPILYAGETTRKVYLPEGAIWQDVWSGKTYDGGSTINASAPLDTIPLFIRNPEEEKLLTECFLVYKGV